MKITKDKLKEMVKSAVKERLNEKFNYTNDLVPDDIAGYAKKVDKFLMDTISKARDLHDEGEEMMRANVLSSYEVQERNRFLLYRVGFLNNLIASLIARLEDQMRQ
jgi:hypothetical protein